jgi:hypothetical protein
LLYDYLDNWGAVLDNLMVRGREILDVYILSLMKFLAVLIVAVLSYGMNKKPFGINSTRSAASYTGSPPESIIMGWILNI